MKHRIFSTAMAAMLLAVSSVGMSASAEETTETTTAIEETTEQEETTTEPKAEEPTETQPYSFSGEDFMAIMNALAGSGKGTMTFTPEESNLPDFYGDDYYDTDGNATLVKSEQIIYNSEEMQFIAVTTKDGHVFYVLINYSAENGEDNVYFLNKVDDFDLYALLYAGQDDDGNAKEFTAEEAEQAVLNAQAANGRVQNSDTPYQPVTTEEADAEEIEPVPVPMNMNSIILVGGVVLLIAIGGVVFLLLRKKPNKPSDDYYEEESEDDIKFYDDNNEE